MALFDDDDDEFPQLKDVDQYACKDSHEDLVCFSILPFWFDEEHRLLGSEKGVYIRGIDCEGRQPVYKRIEAWRVELDCEKPMISVLSSEGNWIRLLNPHPGYAEDIARKFFTKPPEVDDLRKSYSLIKYFMKMDQTLVKSKILRRPLEDTWIIIETELRKASPNESFIVSNESSTNCDDYTEDGSSGSSDDNGDNYTDGNASDDEKALVSEKTSSKKKYNTSLVFQCCNASCGRFYHPKCVAGLLEPDGACGLEKRIADGMTFTCPVHWCFECKQIEDREISFKKKDVTARVWEVPKGDPKIFIYCLLVSIAGKGGSLGTYEDIVIQTLPSQRRAHRHHQIRSHCTQRQPPNFLRREAMREAVESSGEAVRERTGERTPAKDDDEAARKQGKQRWHSGATANTKSQESYEDQFNVSKKPTHISSQAGTCIASCQTRMNNKEHKSRRNKEDIPEMRSEKVATPKVSIKRKRKCEFEFLDDEVATTKGMAFQRAEKLPSLIVEKETKMAIESNVFKQMEQNRELSSPHKRPKGGVYLSDEQIKLVEYESTLELIQSKIREVKRLKTEVIDFVEIEELSSFHRKATAEVLITKMQSDMSLVWGKLSQHLDGLDEEAMLDREMHSLVQKCYFVADHANELVPCLPETST
uniref:Uncharacterized protein n=1 Tax=Oryza sativa subsp. japonica TaxID=39947 RepID=Q6Z985_ORYSJ|nr:hypothetical protein [Oryza sativa Japonica Group]BAD03380.1 hypothetical protein [Oryza sativa Japonica Group]